MAKTLMIRDLTLRDGQQSQFATRMTQAQIDRVLPAYQKAGFYAMEVWGGAVPDSVMRYLNENPWTRLESIKAVVGSGSKLTALSRGRNLFGYNPYPDSVIEGFCRHSVQSGIDIMRIFDALNDFENLKSSIKYVKENGALADCAVCYTADPKFSMFDHVGALFGGRKLPGKIFDRSYFVRKAKELAAMGADIITIKDMAGLVDAANAADLIKAIKDAVDLPINLHTHCTPGFGVASYLTAMVNGVDILDTVIMNFSGGPAAPAFEIIQIFADMLNIDTGVNTATVAEINRELGRIRQELAKFDQTKRIPPDIDLTSYKPEPALARLFADALEAAVSGKHTKTTRLCQQIEAAFNYPEPNSIVQHAQIPGGMYTNMLAQLQEFKLEHMVKEVLQMVPQVRLDAGIPPLVTPTSQIVGAQSVNCIVDKSQGKPPYTNVSKNFVDLVKGSYGKTPYPVDPGFRQKICGSRQEIPYDTSKYKPHPNPELPEFGGARLALGEKEELLLELFPSTAEKYLRRIRDDEYLTARRENPHYTDPLYERLAEQSRGPKSAYSDDFWENLNIQAGT